MLEGVVAYYGTDLPAAAASLTAAQAKLRQLQVPDQLLVALQEMGERGMRWVSVAQAVAPPLAAFLAIEVTK